LITPGIDHIGLNTMAAITIMGSGRVGPTITALLALAAVVLAARALARARRPDRVASDGRDQHPTALWLGIPAVLLGGLFLAAADGGPGTGNGVVGSAAAIVLGLVAIGLDRFTATRHVGSAEH
jgi:hypothetical protein